MLQHSSSKVPEVTAGLSHFSFTCPLTIAQGRNEHKDGWTKAMMTLTSKSNDFIFEALPSSSPPGTKAFMRTWHEDGTELVTV